MKECRLYCELFLNCDYYTAIITRNVAKNLELCIQTIN